MATKKTDAAPPPEAPEPEQPPAAAATPPRPASTRDRFFGWLRALNLRREPGWLGGVAAGIGVRLGIDPIIVRGILVVVAVLGGPALILYAAAWLLLPDANDKIHLEELLKGNVESAIAGIGTLVLLSLLPIAQGFWFAGAAFWGEPYWGASVGRVLWTLAILAAIVLLIVWIARRGNVPTPPRPPATPAAGASTVEFTVWREQQDAFKAENEAFKRQAAAEKSAAWKIEHERQQAEAARRRAIHAEENRRTRSNPLYSFLVIGLALVAGGITTLAFNGDGQLNADSIVGGIAVALAILGLGIIINGLRGKRSGGASAIATLLLFPLAFFAVIPQTPHVDYAGGGYFAPSDTDNESDVYFVGAGDVTLDLADYYVDGEVGSEVEGDDVYLFVGAGDVTITVPDDAFVGVSTYLGSGSVLVQDESGDVEDRGRSPYVTYAPDDGTPTGEAPILQVKVFVGAGDVTIIEPTTSKEIN